MKKFKEELIDYLTGKMSPGERLEFEKILNNTPELMDQKRKYEILLAEIMSTSKVTVDPDYLTSIIPAFRRNIASRERKNKTLKWSLSISSGLAVFVLSLVLLLPGNTDNFTDTINKMGDEEITELVADMELDIYSGNSEEVEKITDIYNEEISAYRISGIITHNDILSSLSEDDAELIYTELINKDLLND